MEPSGQKTLHPIEGGDRSLRRRLTLRDELALALLPTIVVLVVFAGVEILSDQRLLFASLASSAFLIYLDPEHGTNQVRTLITSQTLAAVMGYVAFEVSGGGYVAGGTAMVALIIAMVTLDAMHPPSVATALSFAFRAGDESNLLLFGLALSLIVVLVFLQKSVLWLFSRLSAHRRQPRRGEPGASVPKMRQR